MFTLDEQIEYDKLPPTDQEKVKIHAGILRLRNDIAEISLPENIEFKAPTQDDLEKFYIIVKPQKNISIWGGGIYKFTGSIDSDYPNKGPKLKCETQIFHPNIDENGAVCLNILKADWRAVYTISTIFLGLNELFNYPNPHDSLNKEAGILMINNQQEFIQTVQKTLKGGTYFKKNFQKFI